MLIFSENLSEHITVFHMLRQLNVLGCISACETVSADHSTERWVSILDSTVCGLHILVGLHA